MYLQRETSEIIGSAMEVHTQLGYGILEKPYENALTVEFDLRGIPYMQQPPFDVIYKGVAVGKFIPDLIVYNQVIVDTKAIEKITDKEVGQILNYLKICDFRVALILNFKNPRLEWKRVVL